LAGAIIRLSVGQGTCVATCAELAAMLEEVGGIDRRQIIEQPMPVEPAVRTGPPGPPPPLKVLAMGRLVPIKGLSQLLDALVDVSDIELHIAGDGPLRADLEAKARRLGVPTIFHGVVVGPAKARLMSSCHGFVLASGHGRNGRTEGFPVSVLEALHYGLPVLATPVGGLVELAAEHPDVTLLGAREPMAAALAAFKATMSAHWASKTDEDF
jgi:glycosyltransferase involved in cell wall biosynthesis